jgi:RNA polymerase sigma-70 factor, ECF subfamily
MIFATMQEAGEITQMLRAAREGDKLAIDRVIATLYQELRRVAGIYMSRERGGHTLQPTALVNEACIRLLGQDASSWNDRQHFFACAAQQMRRVLLDYARARNAHKRGGDVLFCLTTTEPAAPTALTAEDMLALDEALDILSKIDPRQCRIVELRYFSGLSEEQIAQVMNITVRTVARDWAHAKATLARHLGRGSFPNVSAS